MKGGKVLIVDDEAMVRDALGPFLVDEGYHVEFAVDGASALDVLTRFTPDVILLDLMMPGMNGKQLLRALRDDARYVDLPVVVMTAVTGMNVTTAFGASEIVEKPFKLDDLLNKVALAVYRARLSRSSRTSEQPPIAPTAPAEGRDTYDGGPAQPPILTVMHTRSALQQLDAFLSERGYTVVSLTRVTSQLPRLARALRPSAILIDAITDASEHAIVEEIRASSELRDVPMVLFVNAQHASATGHTLSPEGNAVPGLADLDLAGLFEAAGKPSRPGS